MARRYKSAIQSYEDANAYRGSKRENHVLREQVRILREALEKAHESLNYAAGYLDDLDSETVVEAVDKGLEAASAALEATKD